MKPRKYTKEKLEEAVKKSTSIYGVLSHFDLSYSGGNHSHIKCLIRYFEIDTSHFTGSLWSKGKTADTDERIRKQSIKVRRTDKDFFSNNTTPTNAVHLRKRLKETGREYQCEKCGNDGNWLGEKITLQIDHKNGIHNDNRLENLRFLCPNCHSQTLTWGNKNKMSV
jgi:predicted RNA-binding Zn-ribbon protein involved in translation (DUF1610 family)